MGDNQNEWNENETPRTYGEDSKLYESGKSPYSQPGGGQSYGNGQGYGSGQPGYGNGQPGYGNGQPGYGNGQSGYGNSQPNYGGQNSYGYQQNGNWQGNVYPQMQHAPVPDVFCNILIAIFFVRMVISFFLMRQTYAAMDDYYSILSGRYLTALTSSSYQILSMLANLLFVATIVFIVLDIVKIHKANYKITGLILFAIFLNPGYYLWRAHILGRKKTFPIIYTVIYGGAMIAYFIYTFYEAFSLAFQMTQSMM